MRKSLQRSARCSAADVPVARRGAAQARGVEPETGPSESIATAATQKKLRVGPLRARRPARARRKRTPGQNALEVAMQPGMSANATTAKRPSDLQRDKRDGKHQTPLAERLRQGGRHDQAGHHDRDEHEAHRAPVRVEPVGEPGGVDPGATTARATAAPSATRHAVEVLEEQMGELRDGEDVDQVEEELHGGDPMISFAFSAQQSLGVMVSRHSRPVPAAW